MRHLRSSMVLSVVPAFFLLGLPVETHFYIDPGTGSIVLQAALGALVGALVAVKMFWRQIKGFFGKLFHLGKKHAEYEEPDD